MFTSITNDGMSGGAKGQEIHACPLVGNGQEAAMEMNVSFYVCGNFLIVATVTGANFEGTQVVHKVTCNLHGKNHML